MKRENVNLILIIITIFILIVIPIIRLFSIEATLDEGTAVMVNEIKNEENKEAQLIKGFFIGSLAGSTILARMIVTFIKFLLIVLCFLELLFILIARNVIKNKEKKITYRVLMTISYIPLTFIVLSMINNIFKTFSPFSLIFIIISVVCLGINFYNTYSKKMYLVETEETIETDNNIDSDSTVELENTNNEEKSEDYESK